MFQNGGLLALVPGEIWLEFKLQLHICWQTGDTLCGQSLKMDLCPPSLRGRGCGSLRAQRLPQRQQPI